MADSSNTSPCKVCYNGALRRFLLTRPASWSEFEHKIRSCFALSPSLELKIQYKDEEGDIITLSTETELQDVLDMHAIFHHGVAVKFDISVSGQVERDVVSPAPTATSASISTTHSRATSVAGPSSVSSPVQQPQPHQLTAWGLAQLNSQQQEVGRHSTLSPSLHESSIQGQETPLAQFYRQASGVSYHKRYGSEQSDDVSLIELEDGMDPPSRQGENSSTRATSPRVEPQSSASINLIGEDRTLIYPVQHIVTAIEQAEQVPHPEEATAPYHAESFSQDSSTSSSISQHTAFEQHESDNDGDDDDGNVVTEVSTAQLEALHIEPTISEETATAATMEKGKGRAIDVEGEQQDEIPVDDKKGIDADPVEPELPSTPTASASTHERNYGNEDYALFEQFQMLIREFQDILQHNPQLVTLASSILDKIVNQVKVNVESFATYLQHQAQQAALSAQQAASEAATHAQQATQAAQQAARESIRESTRGRPFFGPAPGCPFSDNTDFPFFPHHRFMSMGRRGGRGARGGHHFGFCPPPPPPPPTTFPVPPVPPTPPVPPVPSVLPMPGSFHSSSSSSSSSSPATSTEACSTSATPTKQPSVASPFISSFPFVTPPPTCGKPSKMRGHSSGGSSSSTPSSAMPGSFPSRPSMTKVNSSSKWTWMRLPDDDTKDQHLPHSTRAKYGWVWHDGSNDNKTEVEQKASESTAASMEQEGSEPAPLYTPLDTSDPPATFPFGGYSGRSLHTMGNTLHRAHSMYDSHHGHARRSSGSHSGSEAQQATGAAADNAREASLRRSQTMREARQAAEEERTRYRQNRVEQLVKKSRSQSQISSLPIGSSSNSSGLDINPPTTTSSSNTSSSNMTSTVTVRIPGEFPQPTVPTTALTFTPVAEPPASPRAPAVVTNDDTTNPFQDPFEFELELEMLRDMGFEDSDDLRMALRDFGGEITAVVEYLCDK